MARRAIVVSIAGAVVITDIERLSATIVHGGADIPSVGLRAVFQHPASILIGILEVAGVREYIHRLARQRAGMGGNDDTAVIGAAHSTQINRVYSVGVQVADGVGGVRDASNQAVANGEIPFSLLVAGSPMEGDIGGCDAVDSQSRRGRAADEGVDIDGCCSRFVATAAVGNDAEDIVVVGSQAREADSGVGDARSHQSAVRHGDNGVGGTAVEGVNPVEGAAPGSDVGGGEVAHAVASDGAGGDCKPHVGKVAARSL